MARVRKVKERQDDGLDFQCFSARVPVPIYNGVSDWAWENRISLAKAITQLLTDGLRANGREITESKGDQNAASK